MSSYEDFLAAKAITSAVSGLEPQAIHSSLFDFQQAIVRWAIRRGRAAVFADTGLGKTRIQVEWLRQMSRPGLIVAPLAVAEQTIEEAARIDVSIQLASEQPADGDGFWITNYEKLHRFDPASWTSIVLDESSILKSVDGKTRTKLLREWTVVPRRLCCTATPAPNDIAELANHCEFLGIMTRPEMLATYFVHDDEGWRLKGHASEAFYRWLATWAVYIRRPSDLGFADEGFDLPALSISERQVAIEYKPDGELFPALMGGIEGRNVARRQSLPERVACLCEIILASWRNDETAIGGTTTGHTESSALGNPSNTRRLIETGGGPTTAITTQPIERGSLQSSASTAPVLTQRRPNESGEPSTSRIPKEPSSQPKRGDSPIPRPSAAMIFGERMDSLSKTSTDSLSNREDAVRSASGNCQSEAETDSTSITTTRRDFSGESSAPRATSASVSSETIRSDFGMRQHISKKQWLVWCGLNDEQEALAELLGADCVSIYGSLSAEEKIARYKRWRDGEVAVLVSKASIFGFGMNMQFCSRMAFLGLGDSWEQYYQAIRRCWRFGQTQPVEVVIVISEAEGKVAENIWRKEREAQSVAVSVVEHLREFERAEVIGSTRQSDQYHTDGAEGVGWRLLLGDCVERLAELEVESVCLSVHSPPFASLYTYSASDRDMGNSRDYDQFLEHYAYAIRGLLRATMPGRRACVHVQQVATTKVVDGVIGWRDFRADVVKAYVEAGWVYDGEIVIDKDPQAQAIRTKSKALMFVQKNKDSAWSRPAMADYILLFRAPGENPVPVKTDVSNEEWILWARPIWYGIRESETLQASAARSEKDERHIAPLQLETIERCIRLWSNRGELVLDPMAGIGSTGYVALQQGRRFVGVELKPEYWRQAVINLNAATVQGSLFEGLELFA